MIDTRLAPYGALLLRIALGVMFIAHAYLKLAVFTVPGFAGFLGQVGLPQIFAWPIILAEIAGGVALIVGFHARDRIDLAAAGAARRPGHSCAQWLALHRAQWRLGISGLPRRRRVDSGPGRRRRLCLAHQRHSLRRCRRSARRDAQSATACGAIFAAATAACAWQARSANCNGTISV